MDIQSFRLGICTPIAKLKGLANVFQPSGPDVDRLSGNESVAMYHLLHEIADEIKSLTDQLSA